MKLPEESRYTPRDGNDENRGPDEGCIVVSAGYMALLAIPEDLEYRETLRFDSKEKLEQTVEKWNEELPGSLNTKDPHPGRRNKEVTHTL